MAQAKGEANRAAMDNAVQVLTSKAQAGKAAVDDAKTARVALGLRNLAVAAEALRRLPGGGQLADGLLASLDRMINAGGKLYVDGKNQLRRTKPPPQVGWAFLLRIAPWAMRAVGTAVQAARVGLSRFGPGLVKNARTVVGYIGSKAGALLAKVKQIPGVAKLGSLAKKALTAASIALGISAFLPGTRKAVDEVATKAVRKVARGGNKVVNAVASVPEAAAAAASKAGSAVKWVGIAAAGLLALKLLK